MRSGILQVVNFEETDAALARAFVDDGSVEARRKRGDNRRLEIVGRREFRFFDLLLGTFAPIIVRGDQGAIHVAQLESWIGHRVRYAGGNERWRYTANENARHASCAADDETADHHVALRSNGAA